MNIIKLFFMLFFLISCVPKENDKINIPILNINPKDNTKNIDDDKYPFYLIGEPYLINGIKYIPQETNDYEEIGYASYFDKELHGKKSANNEIINVTQMIGSHKTLPLPCAVKITNLENDTALIIRINNRGPMNNDHIISVSFKVAKLLGFHDKKNTRVKLEFLKEESKQLKLATKSINENYISETITAAPISEVNIINLE